MVTTANTWIAISISVCWYLQKNIYIKKTSIQSHEVESAIPIVYSAWWNHHHQEDVGSFPLGMTYQFLIIEIWLFQEETFSCQNWCICNAQLVYIYIWFENVNTWNVNEDAVIFLCDSAYLAGHWQHLNLKWIWMIVSRTTLQQWKIYAFVMHSWCIFYL